MVNTFLHRYRWTRLLNARRTHWFWSSNIPKHISVIFPQYSGKAEPHCLATPVEFGSSHEAIGAGFVDMYLPILNSFGFPSLIPDVCYAWGGYGWHKHIPKHFKHHRQLYASLTTKLDHAPHHSQSPSHVYSAHCVSEPPSCAFLHACFPKTSPVHMA
jgi:hypothetical protein